MNDIFSDVNDNFNQCGRMYKSIAFLVVEKIEGNWKKMKNNLLSLTTITH